MYQFFVDDGQIAGDVITVMGPDVNHMKNALRLKRGERVRVSSACGDFICSISRFSDGEAVLDIVERGVPTTELPARVCLFQGVPKGTRMETVVEKAVELGVHEIIPVDMRYCVTRLDAARASKKVAHWQAIAQSAAKQSKRSMVPAVRPLMDFFDAAELFARCGRRIVPYENEEGMAGARRAFSFTESGIPESVGIFIGPEGGFAEEEIVALRETSGTISLGRRILRTDTAAIAVLSMVMLELEMALSV